MRLFTLSLWFFLFLIAPVKSQSPALLIIPLEISGYTLSAEVTYTPIARAQGLMYRESLDENKGMLFVFPKIDYYSMWMLNTHIPLSVAFIDENGMILNIADMIPHTKTAHQSMSMAKYALEVNLGWFAEKGIHAGAQIIGLEQAPAAK